MKQIILIVLLICIIAGLIIYLHLYKKQIRSITRQLEYIYEKDTNKLLTTETFIKDLSKLEREFNKSLDKYKDVERRLIRTDNNFRETITNISHDIRTPLTAARGYVEMLSRDDISTDKRIEYERVIKDRIIAVQMMLDQLFEYARLEASEIDIEKAEIRVDNILADTISMFYDEFVISGEEPDIKLCGSSKIIGDVSALERVFQNIIRNALVHGKGYYRIISENKGEKYTVYFYNYTDTIEESDIDMIFERFYTTDLSRNKKTTGLGLSIAKKYVSMMDGRISASIEDNIFCIKIEFPLI